MPQSHKSRRNSIHLSGGVSPLSALLRGLTPPLRVLSSVYIRSSESIHRTNSFSVPVSGY